MTRDTDVRAVLRPLWRGVVVFRVVALLAAVVNLVRFTDDYARPVLAVVVVALMAAWTLVTARRYPRGHRWLDVADLGLTAVATASTLLVDTPGRVAAGGPVITTVWSAGAVLAVAVTRGPRGGLAGAAVTVAVLLAVRRTVDDDLLYDALLLVVVGLAVGLAADALRRSARRLQEAVAAEAATRERERLARDIHDGVLQVLARVHRDGDLGLAGPELARLAGEQERSLRRLISTGPAPPGDTGSTDLVAGLAAALPERTSLAGPGAPVVLPAAVARGLVAAAREAATNADRHAGAGTGLWVLVEQDHDAVVVAVRDDGHGVPDGRLAAAATEGHLGVASSIRGRLRELGGTAELVTAPGAGTEWEFRVPCTPTEEAP